MVSVYCRPIFDNSVVDNHIGVVMQFIRAASDQSKLAAMKRMRDEESRTAMLRCSTA